MIPISNLKFKYPWKTSNPIPKVNPKKEILSLLIKNEKEKVREKIKDKAKVKKYLKYFIFYTFHQSKPLLFVLIIN